MTEKSNSPEWRIVDRTITLLREVGWTRGAPARDKDGQPIQLDRASCFCTMGALARAADLEIPDRTFRGQIHSEIHERIKAQIRPLVPQATPFVSYWNDHVAESLDEIVKHLTIVRDSYAS